MKGFENILLCFDDRDESRFSLRRVVEMTNRSGGQLTVLGIVQKLPRDLYRLAAAMPLDALQDLACQELYEHLAPFIAPFELQGLPVRLEVCCGKPFIEIIRTVQRRQHDMVIVTAENRCNKSPITFAASNLRLIRQCPCPVWVINASLGFRYARILAAVDPDPLEVVRDGVNTKILELAGSLAEMGDGELHVLHVWKLCKRTVLRGWQSRVPASQLRDWAEQTREAHQRRFDQLLEVSGLEQRNPRPHMIQGDAGTVIAEFAREEHIDVVVMGTMARTGIRRYVSDNTAETVLRRVACAVLAVKPNGFISSVDPNADPGSPGTEELTGGVPLNKTAVGEVPITP